MIFKDAKTTLLDELVITVNRDIMIFPIVSNVAVILMVLLMMYVIKILPNVIVRNM